MLQDLVRAQEDYVMSTDMHLTYLITPIEFSPWPIQGPDWSDLYQMLNSLQVLPLLQLNPSILFTL